MKINVVGWHYNFSSIAFMYCHIWFIILAKMQRAKQVKRLWEHSDCARFCHHYLSLYLLRLFVMAGPFLESEQIERADLL